MPIPPILTQIADDVLAARPRRAKVRTLFGYYGLQRRGVAGIAKVRADLRALNLETSPDFAVVGFDDQVRFVPLGQGITSFPLETIRLEEPVDFDIQPEAGSASVQRFRVLLRSYDAFERLRDTLVTRRLAKVLQAGQNARREDRDRFPFLLVIQPPGESTEESVRGWVQEAVDLTPSVMGDNVPSDDLPAIQPSIDEGALIDTLANYQAMIISHANERFEELQASGLPPRIEDRVI